MQHSPEDVFAAVQSWRRVVARSLRNRDDVDDVLSDGCLAILGQIRSGEEIRFLKTYALRVLRFLAIHEIRRRMKDRERFVSEQATAFLSPAIPSPDPFAMALREERMAIVDRALARPPGPYHSRNNFSESERVIIRMQIDGDGARDIVLALGATAARLSKNRALVKLRRIAMAA